MKKAETQKKMKNCERSVRQYNKSELPRLRWTPQLHQHFVQAIQSIGGKHKATPKRILQQMRVRGLSIAHIKSHLQMYRNMKDYAKNSADELVEGNANDFKLCSISPTQRIILKGELHLLDNKKGLLQSTEETDYDLNQEGQSSEEENVPNLLFSFSRPLISMMQSDENSKDMMQFPSSTAAAANHSITFGNSYINLDLTI
ncbi:hypothetical protein PHAVU_008G196200 [Phaseolus vulgaris]|uniref:HTH myb-type domain-containing protein n=1 Tax=Phaseolus vulgaris TaxID=3885 RepID=V7B6J7_PHAVU|nr:hypothetical protein PHAVU_008G196200g [Phaseolus vulgaris]ESW13439.1 hypothetical protein PHAVU_008G196200g [Phaseolus vulgaris]